MKRTKLLCLQNIRFFKDGHLLLVSSENLEFAGSVAVTFEMQKMTRNIIWSSMVGQTIPFCVSSAIGMPCQSDLDIPGHYVGYFSLCSLVPWQTWTDNIAPSDCITSISLRNHRWGLPPLWAQQNWHTRPLLGSRNGNVPSRGTSVHHHAHRKMVEQRIFALYSKAGQAVLAKGCKENANTSIVPNDPRRRTSCGIKQRSPAAWPSWQRQDEEKYWTQRISMGSASGLLSFQLIIRRCGDNS